MTFTNLGRSLLAVACVLILSAPCYAGLTLVWRWDRPGHLKLWWTKDGIRITSYPFYDNDVVEGTRLGHRSPDDCNDVHEQFIKEGESKSTKTSVVAGVLPGPGHQFPTFEEYLGLHGEAISWFSLGNEEELFDMELDVTVDLVVWGNYLQANPLPDENSMFLFDAAGICPELPGYEAYNVDAAMPYAGPLVVFGVSTLSLLEPRGDFDVDGDVDGSDFLIWQRGELLDPLSPLDLADWQISFGAEMSPIPPASTMVPEPAAMLLLMLGLAIGLDRAGRSLGDRTIDWRPNPGTRHHQAARRHSA
jgi:hypothetical protein